MPDRPLILLPVPLNQRLTAGLEKTFDVVKLYEADNPDAVLGANAARIRGLASNGKLAGSLLEALPNLEIVCNFGVGVDGLDLETARRRNVIVTNTPSVLTDAVADTALLLLLAVTRGVIRADRFVRDGSWPKTRLALAPGLYGKLCGIVGMGRIGQAIALRAQAFGMDIAWTGPRAKPDLAHRYVPDIVALAEEADVLILALPGGEGTRHAVDARVLAALGSQGYLVNIARGSVVDEAALLDALRNGTIAGAGLDVFENEPHIDPGFAALENTVLMPHLGSATVETRNAMADLVLENLTRHFAGQPVLTPVE
jgi:lactate dehydrogenase-like 2-hydroxyacid dehydrogenase